MAQHVSVAILADSSVAVAGQWQQILRDYIGPLLGRLVNGMSRQLNIAFVTYALAETKPSPIVARRYFSNPGQATKEIREEPSKLGLGSTTTGGRTGMAVLEGYAAVLEMFDLLSSSNKENMTDRQTSDTQPQLYYIFHICAGLPNEMVHPCHNQSTEFDTLSWRTLPEEMKKRNMNLNIFMLKNSPKLVELHSATVPDPCPPWFSTRSDHSILLSSQSLWALPSGAAKRKEELLNDNPESKRVRINSPKEAQSSPIPASQPKPTQPLETKPANIASPVTQSQPPPQPQTQPQPQPQAQPPPNNQQPANAAANPLAMLRSLQLFEEALKKQVIELDRLSQQGPASGERIQILKRQLPQKFQMLKRMKEQYVQKFGAAISANNNITSSGSAASATAGNTVPAKPASSASTTQPHAQTNPSDAQSLAQFVQARQAQQSSPDQKPSVIASNANPPAGSAPLRQGPTPANIPSHLVAQMQKLASKEGIPGQSQMPLLKPPTPSQTQPPPQTLGQGTQQIAAAQTSASRPVGDPNRWRGIISWPGRENNGSSNMKMEAHVVAVGRGGASSIRSDLWPQVLEIGLSTQQAVPIQELKDWIVQHKPAICSISRDPSIPDNNRFHSFCQLLSEKRIYALGSWVIPGSPTPRPTILIFSAGTLENVAGLVFPETGLPDIPKPMAAPPMRQPQIQPQAPPQPANQPGPSNPVTNNAPAITPALVRSALQKLATNPGMVTAAQQIAALPFEQQVAALQRFQAHNLKLKQAQQVQLQLQLQAQAAARGNNPAAMNVPGGPWGQATFPQGFNPGMNNNAGGGGQMPNLGFPGFNMNQAAQMLPKGFNMSGPNMNLMNMNGMNMGAGMQLGTLGGMAAGSGGMQQPQRPGQPNQGGAQPNAGESVQSFLQRNGLSGGGGMR